MTTLFVPGTPTPQGSTKAFVRNGRAMITHSNNKTMPWRDSIAAHAMERHGLIYPRPTALRIDMIFLMPRRAAEPKRRIDPHTRKPDLDKLVRAVLDALTGVWIEDDSQIVAIGASKETAAVGQKTGVALEVALITGQRPGEDA